MSEVQNQSNIRITEVERVFLQRTTAEMLFNSTLLDENRQGVLDYCNFLYTVTKNEFYLTGRQMRALSFILHIGLKHTVELSLAGKNTQSATLADALSNLALFLHQGTDWESAIAPLRSFEMQYPAGDFDYTKHLERIRDKPATC